jgi:long-chain acyl-CoA synthetase
MIHDHLLRIVESAPASSGLRRGESFASYASLLERIDRLAAGLIERGIGPGSVVALLVPNSPEIFVAAHALFAVGAIAMPLSVTATRPELVALGGKTGLAAVIAAPAFHKSAEALIADLAPRAPLLSTDRFADLERPAGTLPKPAGTDTALFLFSSGSTGLPKVVPHTHAQLIADGNRTSTAWDLQPDDVAVNILPPNFAMGFLMGVVDVVSRGASTVYWNDPLPLALSRRKLLETMVRDGVTFMGAVPAMYEIIAGQTGDFDLKVRLAFSGGAALKRSIFEGVRERFGIALRQSYGSTEAIFVSHNNSSDPDATWASVGAPAGDAQVRIAPVESNLGPGVGELEIKSSSLMTGYLGDAGANAEAFDDGWFRSGDLALLDDAGRIVIKGRSKLLIEVSGYKVDPIEVEDALVTLPAVAEAAVAGIPDPRNGNRLVAFVVRESDVTADDIIRHARARLSIQKVPVEIAFVDALPRSPTGKLLRAQLKYL